PYKESSASFELRRRSGSWDQRSLGCDRRTMLDRWTKGGSLHSHLCPSLHEMDQKYTCSSAGPVGHVLVSPLFPLPVELCWICCSDGSLHLYRQDGESCSSYIHVSESTAPAEGG
ncbi:unnamed protein product, partial [Bubo scandiacus]